MTKIIGIHGKIGSGKDTVMKMMIALSENSNCELDDVLRLEDFQWIDKTTMNYHPVEVRRFADPLKDAICSLYDISRDSLELLKDQIAGSHFVKDDNTDYFGYIDNNSNIQNGCSIAISPFTYGQLHQYLGNDFFREKIHKDFFVQRYAKKETLSYKSFIITPDMRYMNELLFIKNKGGFLIKIEGDDRRKKSRRNKNHISETELDGFKNYDFVIQNNGTLQNLFDNVKDVFFKIKHRTKTDEFANQTIR